MKKFYFLLLTVLSLSFVSAQGTIDFDTDGNWSPAPSGYGDYTYTDTNFTATGVDVLRNTTSAQDGFSGAFGTYSFRLRNNSGTSLTMIVGSGGIGTFSFQARRWDGNPATNFTVETTTDNGASWSTSSVIDATVTDDSDWKTINGTINSANSNVGVRIISNGTTERIMVDNFTWTAFSTSCGVTFDSASYICNTNVIGDNNDSVTVQIPYTGLDAAVTAVTTTSGGTVGGDDPAVTTDGIITITGLTEGDAWDINLVGGDCGAITASGTIAADLCDPTPNTCFDLSNGTELFELVAVTTNSSGNNNGTWSESGGTYSANAFCGGGCAEPVESWLVFGPLDMTGVTDLTLAFDAAEAFGVTDLNIAYTDAYSGCPTGSSWTTAQTITAAGSYEVDLSAATGTDVFIGIQYLDDGADGYSGWDLSNVSLDAFGACPTLGTRPTSNCAVCDLILGEENIVCLGNTTGAGNDMVTIEIPYTGVEGTITSLSTTSAGTIGGDDPATVTDGTITITGLGEGDAWDLTINGGDCDGTTISGTVFATNCDPSFLVINEILSDPDATTGDANGDGTVDTSQDEFVELYNTGTVAIDLTDYIIADGASDRHVFPAGTMLAPNTFITVFGGGTPTGISGMSQVASTGVLGLNNGGDTVTIKNAGGVTVAEYTYGSEGGNNQSIAREPDFTGAFVQHLSHTTTPVQFSPGSENDNPALSNTEFEQANFSIYPNPTNKGYVNIKTTSNSAVNVTVFDLLGKKVITKTLSNDTLNVSNLKAGVYLLNIEQNGASTTKKLVIE
ncbi:lamin tail domain-containing protein [Mesoflavibacter sp.]|uniref:T9SS type A sorting domain-containing protein n=1 Tax=Mesoflavibacter sp. TaxID=1930902 RepID=UPI0035193619